jgi:hypothetical protein
MKDKNEKLVTLRGELEGVGRKKKKVKKVNMVHILSIQE